MAKSFRQLLLRRSDDFLRTVSSSNHPGAVGDALEIPFRAWLSEMVGESYGVTKGEIVDSDGRTSGQLDAIVYDRRTVPCIESEHGLRVIRVESVAVTIELKTGLEGRHLDEIEAKGNQGVDELRRYFRVQRLIAARAEALAGDPGYARYLELGTDGVRACESEREFDVPRVVCAVFALRGLSLESVAKRVRSGRVDAVCIPRSYTAAKRAPSYFAGESALDTFVGDDALPRFLETVLEAIEAHSEWQLGARFDWPRYFRSNPEETP